MVQFLAPTLKNYNKCDENIKAGGMVRFIRWPVDIYRKDKFTYTTKYIIKGNKGDKFKFEIK